MALSYKESIERIKTSSKKETEEQPITLTVISDENNMVALADSETSWTIDDSYDWYDEYEDDNLSSIDGMKNVTVDTHQINLTQESNSQFVPFVMNRYYDGIDLTTKTIWIHYITPKKSEDLIKAINVKYSDDEIEFAWLITASATVDAGVLQFEILASGTNEKGDAYVWKSRIGKLNVLQALDGEIGDWLIDENGNIALTSDNQGVVVDDPEVYKKNINKILND